MKPGIILRTFLLAALIFSPYTVFIKDALGGMLRIMMHDGTAVDVPYFWEESGEIKFQIAGGVAGFPKDQVASIQEVITGGEFDPEVLLESTGEGPKGIDDRKRIQDLITNKTSPGGKPGEKLSTEESLRLLKHTEGKKKEAGAESELVSTPLYNLEEEFAELVRPEGGEVMLVIKDVLSSRADLKKHGFTASFYDGEGNLLHKKPCEVQELDVDKKTLRKMGMRGRLFAVTASVRPDSHIKRYEITTSH